ncbi:N-acetyl-gamma-glutamyl-phosphate reductase [Candidatus Nanopelagicus limnes]|uniref:N-acetyl-gamma-glutamyl-phosphate reductase n=1 Tax=Candidatus Nanopelagicus limnae TaxID=1884634 RepID=A0A249JY13_9ACTN|nr:N-acetyl-gamma-glutamyl-phosphate reductase [Candidatus Nanopelagicus limnes]ASY09402.1 N-acetyl-gamma-glutamyl-phosphate reductase [Candidatus Nanopelagicus limnes]
MKIGVVGASGYAGGELLRLLSEHPNFEISFIGAHTNAGESITALHPQLIQFEGQQFSAVNVDDLNKCDLVFTALPHGESAKLISQLNEKVKIVDLGADYRLTDKTQWDKYYGGSYAGSWTYGLPELTDHQLITKSKHVASPGCYATAIALSVAPVINQIDSEDIVVVAASGTTGAGRTAKVNLIGSEVMNNLTSYKFGGVHQHTPEIEQILSSISNKSVKISFTPILAPMPRGILATVTAKLITATSAQKLRTVYSDFYDKSKFVSLLTEGQMPMTNSVLGTSNVSMQIALDSHVNRIIISTAIDNLGKGAAGQAIQNANLMCNLAEDAGLKLAGVR